MKTTMFITFKIQF